MSQARRILPALCVGALIPTLLAAQVGVRTSADQRAVSEETPAEATPARPAAGAEPEQSPPVSPTPDRRAAIAEFVDGLALSQRRQHGLAALTVAVVKDDSLWLARGYGWADLAGERPVVADQTLFRIGSVSKTFTWTAATMLAERGLLDLDADVNTYLKRVTVREAFGRPVTMRHLMHHRAGFEDSFRLFAVSDDDPRPLAELLAEHQPKRVFAPGTRLAYSNWGSALAAQIVEDAAGAPYGDFLRREILEPLGMRDTTWVPPAAMDAPLRERLAVGYRPEKGALGTQGFMQIGAYWPAGGMAATATDMARWMRFHLNGGELDGVRLLSAENHDRMWTRAFGDRPEAADFAHGFIDQPYRGLRTLGHGGGTAAFLTNMVLVPELNLGVFLSQNSAHEFSPLAQLPGLVIDRLVGQTYRPLLVAEDDGKAPAELAGTYLNTRRVFSTFSAVLALAGAVKVTPFSEDGLVVSGMGETAYYRRVPGGNELFEDAAGDRIAVLRDASGGVWALAAPYGELEPLGVFRTPAALYAALGLVALLALTTVLGVWRRFGRQTGGGFASRVAGGVAMLAVLAVMVFISAVATLAIGFESFDLSEMPGNYPGPAMFFVHYAGWLVAAAAATMLVALWPAWSGSDWPLWRRLHFSLFTLAMVVLAIQLWQWRIIGAAVI